MIFVSPLLRGLIPLRYSAGEKEGQCRNFPLWLGLNCLVLNNVTSKDIWMSFTFTKLAGASRSRPGSTQVFEHLSSLYSLLTSHDFC